MKKIILSFIKFSSFIILIISFILLFLTFFNKSFYFWLWQTYLKYEVKNKINNFDEKLNDYANKNTKLWWFLDKTWLNKIKGKSREKIENNIDKNIEKYFSTKNNVKDIKIFWKSLKEELGKVKNNFIKDIRIFLITNIIGFLMIYLLLFYRKRKDIIKNMFYIIVIMFLVLLWGLIFYVIWQNWIINIITNSFLWYVYPILIIIFTLIFMFFYKRPIESWEILSITSDGINNKINDLDVSDVVLESSNWFFSFIISMIFIPFDL